MLRKYKLIVIAAGLFFLGSSCTKVVDLAPENSTYEDVFWQNQKEAEQGVAGAYALLRRSLHGGYDYTSFFMYGDVPTGEFTEAGASSFDRYVLNQVRDFNFNGSYVDGNDWGSYYKVIAQCNLVMKKVPEIPDAKFTDDATITKNKLIGEAYFLRAFTLFYISRIWGDVPVVTQLEDALQSEDIGQTPAADVMKQCIADCQEAITRLSWGYANSSETAVRANKGSVYALLAHIYMWTGDAEKAAAAAEEVIEKGGYSLVSRENYKNVFIGQSSEGIFEIARGYSQGETSLQSGFQYKCLKDPYVSAKTEACVVNKTLVNSLYTDPNDVRRNVYFADMTTTTPILIKYANVIYGNAATKTDAYVSNNLIIFRLADILLLHAEALAKLDRFGEARTALKEVTDRAGEEEYTGADSDLYEYIIDERSRELFCEGHRYYDMVRSGFLEEKLGMAGSRINKKGYYWPISSTLLTNNPKLVQVEFWR